MAIEKPTIEKLAVGDPDTQSADLVDGNIERLREIFPEAFTEGRVDFEVLRQLLGDHVEDGEERFGLNWKGKRAARRLALTPSTGTLRPAPEESVDWDTTQHLMIEGDNLEVLKLLQKSYAGKVKLIYIDPPYNTGGDFIYADSFQDSIGRYLELTGQSSANGEKAVSTPEAAGRFHTAWLTMMYPRLLVARDLLAQNGVLFVSIDDNEHHNLRHVLDEVFGPENFVGAVAWKHTAQSKNDERYFARQYNTLLVYRRSEGAGPFRLERTDAHNVNYGNPDDDPRGPWRSGDTRSPNPRPSLRFDIPTPSGKTIAPPPNGWRWSATTIQEKIDSGEIIFSADETRIIRKIYLADQEGRVPENLWPTEDVGGTRDANRELQDIFGSAIFDTPKPTLLIRRMLELATEPDESAVVLDFFAGSGATGHAVLLQNNEDEGDRRFVLVQLPEATDLEEFPTIAEITKARLALAGEKIREANPMLTGDLGFRVFKLDSSNIREWDPQPEDLEAALELSVENLKADRTEQDILYELLLKRGIELTVPIETREIAGKPVHNIGAGTLFACLATPIERADAEPLAEGIAKWRDELDPAGEVRVIFRDSAFVDDVAKTNLAEILKQRDLTDVKSI